MGSTINKNEHILHKSQSEVLGQNLDQSKLVIRTSTITQTRKQLVVVSSLKKSLQQSIKVDGCDDSPLQQLNTNQQKQNPQEKLTYDLNREIKFEARALNSQIKSSRTNSTTIPAIIILKAKDLLVEQDQRTGLDQVCIIDRSGSMCGEKIKMVQDTLLTLLNFLSKKDRFSIILFDHRTQILFKLKKVTQQKKIIFQELIFLMVQLKGIELLKQKNSINQVTSKFLLSDVQDEITEQDMCEIFSNVNFPFNNSYFWLLK